MAKNNAVEKELVKCHVFAEQLGDEQVFFCVILKYSFPVMCKKSVAAVKKEARSRVIGDIKLTFDVVL